MLNKWKTTWVGPLEDPGDRVSLGKANDAGPADTGTVSDSCALLTRQTEDS